MVIDIILTIAGAGVLLLLTFGGLIATQARKSEQLLVAPRGARFGDASRLARRTGRQRRLSAVEAPDTEASTVQPSTFAQSDRHAA